MRSRKDEKRILTHPGTGEKRAFSMIRDEVYFPDPPYDAGDWGKYVFGAWLEEDADAPGMFYISFPYWRNGRFAGQYTMRTEPRIIRHLVEEMQSRGWFEKKSWLDQPGDVVPPQGPEPPPNMSEGSDTGKA